MKKRIKLFLESLTLVFNTVVVPRQIVIFIARNVRGGKVMFSLVSVCPQTGGYAWSHVPSGGVPAWSQVPSRGWVCPGGWVYWREVYQGVRYTRGSGIPEGVYQRGVYQRGWVCCGGMYTHPTPGTSHHNTYGWQACGTYPTGMLSCCE